MKSRLAVTYREKVIPMLKDMLKRDNILSLPRIEKICLNMGVGEAIEDSKLLDSAVQLMGTVAGQAPVVTKARMSVSNFKLREGYKIGCKVTLRSDAAYEFLDRLISIAIPRIRDFRGISDKGFDNFGNFSMGIDEITIFPEVDADKIDTTQGMNVTIVIKNARNSEESKALLTGLGMPFVR